MNNKTIKYQIKNENGVVTLEHNNKTKGTFYMTIDEGDEGARLTIVPSDPDDGVTAISAFWTDADPNESNLWTPFTGNGLGTTVYYDFSAPKLDDKTTAEFFVIAQSGTDYIFDDPTFILKTKRSGADDEPPSP